MIENAHPVPCLSCSPAFESLQQVIRDLQDSERTLNQMVEGYERDRRRAILTENQLRGELSEKHKTGPKAEQVKGLLEDWKRITGHSRARIPLDGKRAKLVRARLNEGFSVAELRAALLGLKARPFVGPHGRVKDEVPGATRYDDVEHALRDEATVERFKRYAQEEFIVRPEMGVAA